MSALSGAEDPELTAETPLLNHNYPSIVTLISTRDWLSLNEKDRIGAVYDFVRTEIPFGYNRADDIAASEVLRDGYGQCNTKGTLLMALLRGVSVPCRLHGFTIHKSLQRGVVPELVYPIAPDDILHSWVEVLHEGEWIELEGFILDDDYLARLQGAFVGTNSLCAYGVGTESLQNPGVLWSGRSTYIQRTGINKDFGIFDSPDDFYAAHRQDFPWWKAFLYRHAIRHWMNCRVRNIRRGRMPADVPQSAIQTQA